ncbi:MAG: hypothetical protein JWR32_718 [Mycobacterium sp.]|jgi:hypothetical protein|nr:hypothetical protein [Mycobacterium sp.]
MLGIHITVAVAWQRASAGDWTDYAAEISRRIQLGRIDAMTENAEQRLIDAKDSGWLGGRRPRRGPEALTPTTR